MITDTQILSYYYKDAMPLPSDPIFISSITAAEFLLIQSSEPTKANYYPLLPHRFRGMLMNSAENHAPLLRMFDSKKHAALGRHRTDQIILDLSGEMKPVIEFGSVAISEIINHRHGGLFSSSILHLPKISQKKLKAKYRFLLDAKVQCLPLNQDIARAGLNILDRFLMKYEAKLNSRNTINDVLILSTAITHSRPLLTNDHLLKRFAADLVSADVLVKDANILIDFSAPAVVTRQKRLETKGYVNRGWQVLERRAVRT